MANFAIERRLKKLGYDVIIGVDEAGRGPLAGPVVTAAVCLESCNFKNRIDDSKKLSPKEREAAFLEISQKSMFALSVGDEELIDTYNILVATRLCMEDSVLCLLKKIGNRKTCIIVDGNVKLRITDYSVFNIYKGDQKSKTIASASILAKVSRDRIMALYHRVWPQYGFIKHKGYPTILHRQALRKFGPCSIHRLSFSYV